MKENTVTSETSCKWFCLFVFTATSPESNPEPGGERSGQSEATLGSSSHLPGSVLRALRALTVSCSRRNKFLQTWQLRTTRISSLTPPVARGAERGSQGENQSARTAVLWLEALKQTCPWPLPGSRSCLHALMVAPFSVLWLIGVHQDNLPTPRSLTAPTEPFAT